MGTGVRQSGFTIIEIILFLAASSLLAAGIFAGSLANINQQRYIDASRSLKALLQEQFINTTRVRHAVDPDSNIACPVTGVETRLGQSDCIIMGRLISVAGGSTITLSNIIGVVPAGEDYSGGDLVAIQTANAGDNKLHVDVSSAEIHEPQWSTKLRTPDGLADFSIAIIRSPSTGTPYVFRVADPAYVDESEITTGSIPTDFEICVDSDGLLTLTKKSVFIRKNAAGPNGIEEGDSSVGC